MTVRQKGNIKIGARGCTLGCNDSLLLSISQKLTTIKYHASGNATDNGKTIVVFHDYVHVLNKKIEQELHSHCKLPAAATGPHLSYYHQSKLTVP